MCVDISGRICVWFVRWPVEQVDGADGPLKRVSATHITVLTLDAERETYMLQVVGHGLSVMVVGT